MNVKICGLTGPDDVDASAKAGATYVGINFFPKSPRYVTPEAAQALCAATAPGVVRVGLLVNPDDALVRAVAEAGLDMLQLHGGEAPERVAELRAMTGLPVMKVIGVADQDDLIRIPAYEDVADQILIDAKPPRDAVLPGGNGVTFDWRLIAGRTWTVPWMLAGGLTPDNVAEAIRLTGADQVDVASGVESAPGVKSPDLIAAFCAAALSA